MLWRAEDVYRIVLASCNRVRQRGYSDVSVLNQCKVATALLAQLYEPSKKEKVSFSFSDLKQGRVGS